MADEPAQGSACGALDFTIQLNVEVELEEEEDQALLTFLQAVDHTLVERETREQVQSDLSLEVRKPRITASTFNAWYKFVVDCITCIGIDDSSTNRVFRD